MWERINFKHYIPLEGKECTIFEFIFDNKYKSLNDTLLNYKSIK